MPLTRIISGGQTGADRGGLDAGRELGLAIGGFCPAGRRAEDGSIPADYPLVELASPRYPPRTRANVEAADATVVFTLGAPDRGTRLTLDLARSAGKPCLWLNLADADEPEAIARLRAWLDQVAPTILNVAGSRESNAPGLANRTRRVLVAAIEEIRR